MRIVNSIFYHGIIAPISRLPFGVLYFFSDCLFYFLFYVVRYRRETIRGNIDRSFPELTESQKNQIERKFFSHLIDLIFESVKLFTVSKKRVQEWVNYLNPEVVNRYYDEGRSVVVVTGHYNNWELVAASMDMPLKHQTIGIYQKLTSPYFEKKMKETRSRFGMRLITTKEVKEVFASERTKLTATIFGFDQSPSPSSNPHWMTFLNQDTAVQFGTEKYAKEYDYPVIYSRMNKIRRGYYNLEFEDVCATPRETAHGELTEKLTRLLEKDIRLKPEFWLWSHKRWKLKRNV